MRTKLFTAFTVLAALSLVACGDDDGVTPADGGPRDGGMADLDAGGGDTDAGGGDTDAGGDVDGGMVATPRGRESPPTIGDAIDRTGRPGVSTATVATFTPDANRATRRGAYSAESDPTAWAAYADEIAASLAIIDALDTTCGNQLLAAEELTEDRYATLAGVLANDRLWLDTTSGTNDSNLYLGVEAEALGLVEEGGAGGRRPTDDVIERTYSLLAAGALGGVDDTIAADDGEPSNTAFPFLGAPE